jgi:hypothetical protein
MGLAWLLIQNIKLVHYGPPLMSISLSPCAPNSQFEGGFSIMWRKQSELSRLVYVYSLGEGALDMLPAPPELDFDVVFGRGTAFGK